MTAPDEMAIPFDDHRHIFVGGWRLSLNPAADAIASSEPLRIFAESSDRFHSFGRRLISSGVVFVEHCESTER